MGYRVSRRAKLPFRHRPKLTPPVFPVSFFPSTSLSAQLGNSAWLPRSIRLLFHRRRRVSSQLQDPLVRRVVFDLLQSSRALTFPLLVFLKRSLQLIPAIILLSGCWFVLPESPRWLAAHGRHLEALETLANVHRAGDVTDPFVLAQWGEIREYVLLFFSREFTFFRRRRRTTVAKLNAFFSGRSSSKTSSNSPSLQSSSPSI